MMKVRVMDYTLDVYCVGIYSSLRELTEKVSEYVSQSDAQCTELVAEQWDPEHELWISYSPATAQAQQRIDEIFNVYRRLMG